VRVDDNVGLEAVLRIWHIALGNDETASAFLTMATRVSSK